MLPDYNGARKPPQMSHSLSQSNVPAPRYVRAGWATFNGWDIVGPILPRSCLNYLK
jgi:hypothetical protein